MYKETTTQELFLMCCYQVGTAHHDRWPYGTSFIMVGCSFFLIRDTALSCGLPCWWKELLVSSTSCSHFFLTFPDRLWNMVIAIFFFFLELMFGNLQVTEEQLYLISLPLKILSKNRNMKDMCFFPLFFPRCVVFFFVSYFSVLSAQYLLALST